MDQLKDFLRQCVKYRFWIAFGVALILPIIGYFVGSGAIVKATTTRVNEIKGAKTEISKYTPQGVVNAQYQPIAAQKKEVLTKDVDATWRKLFALQEPLLRWPEDVEAKFRKWGRKFPNDVDLGQVQATINDYTLAYPAFVNKIYKVFKPFNFDTGEGIVVAPEESVLLRPAPFSPDALPELGKVWAEQERIWVVTALLDVVAKVNDSVKAKDWDGAIVKQINLVEVGSQADQDQKSIAKGETLVPAEPLMPEGAAATTVAAAAPASGEMSKRMEGMMGSGVGKAATDEVYYIKTEGQQYKILPIRMIVLVDQAKLPDFLVALENSPMSIQVKEAEIAKPLTSVTKPAYGERSSFNMGMGSYNMSGPGGGMSGMAGGMSEGNMRMMMGGQGGRGMMSGGAGMREKGGAPGNEMMMLMGGMGGTSAASKKGVDMRNVNKAAERKKNEKESSKSKAEIKKVDQYFNVIEVTVYGQARFYSAPPPLPEASPSTASATSTTSEPAKPQAAPPATTEVPAKQVDSETETPKAKPAEPKAEAPKAEAPKAEAPKAEAPKAEAPKAEAPKAEAPKPDASKPADATPDAPRNDSPKADSTPPKR